MESNRKSGGIDFSLIAKRVVEENDEKAFRMLFDHFYPQLFRYALYYVRQPVSAEEVISDVFYKMLTKRREMDEIKNVGYYLYRAVKNQCLTFLRDRKRKVTIEPMPQDADYIIAEQTDPESQVVEKENLLLMERAVEKLPAQRQLIFRLIREEGMNFKEVGDLLNISPRTVETHLGLAIKDLCNALKSAIGGAKQGKIRKMFS